MITNPAGSSLTVTTSVATIGSTASAGIAGHPEWTNALTGGTGSLAVASSWTIASIPVGDGTNLITVVGSNTSGQVVTKASDAADASAYDPAWDSGDNAGTGSARGRSTPGANAGHFRATKTGNPTLTIGNYAWGLWANSQQMAEGSRAFSNAVAVGDSLSFKFQNGGVDGTGTYGSSVGVAIKNRHQRPAAVPVRRRAGQLHVGRQRGRPEHGPWVDE